MKTQIFIFVLLIHTFSVACNTSANQTNNNNTFISAENKFEKLLEKARQDGVNIGARSKELREKAKFANEKALRLRPGEFSELSAEIVKSLENRGCTIPQTWHDKVPHNVISGEFFKKGQTDWAVLCSINQVSSILILWNGSTEKVAEIAKSDDSGYFQVVADNDEMGFSRGIYKVDKKYIIDHYNSYGGTKPPPIDHEGISDAYVEKASTVLYLYRGKWLELQGAD
jgi:hypothetical protein